MWFCESEAAGADSQSIYHFYHNCPNDDFEMETEDVIYTEVFEDNVADKRTNQ